MKLNKLTLGTINFLIKGTQYSCSLYLTSSVEVTTKHLYGELFVPYDITMSNECLFPLVFSVNHTVPHIPPLHVIFFLCELKKGENFLNAFHIYLYINMYISSINYIY